MTKNEKKIFAILLLTSVIFIAVSTAFLSEPQIIPKTELKLWLR